MRADITDRVDEPIPWRKAFPEYAGEDIPAFTLLSAQQQEGLTQKVLAAKAGIPQAHISLMERGKMTIGVTRAKRLGKALNTGYKGVSVKNPGGLSLITLWRPSRNAYCRFCQNSQD